jgi:hypothetical protein
MVWLQGNSQPEALLSPGQLAYAYGHLAVTITSISTSSSRISTSC